MLTETRALIAKARADIAEANGDQLKALSTDLLDAVDAFLTACSNQRAVDDARIADLEITVRALSTAVLSITESVSQSAPAILALQDDVAKSTKEETPPE